MNADATKPVVLVVDDAPDTLGMLSQILEKAGMTALVAGDGKSALALLEHMAPDLILMDAVMPLLDGFETCRAIKKRENFAHTPVVFMTGLSDTDNVIRGFNAGGVDYLTKPIVPDEMIARVRVHLANSRMTQSVRRALDVAGPPLLSADAAGMVRWVTPHGLALLGELKDAPDWREKLAPALKIVIEKKQSGAVLPIGTPNTVLVSLVGEAQPDEYLLRLKDANAPREDQILKAHFLLTDREAEVLMWIAKGKSNRDIAEILDCSPRTVNKHLEQIYDKIEVENRTAAAMRAIHVLGG